HDGSGLKSIVAKISLIGVASDILIRDNPVDQHPAVNVRDVPDIKVTQILISNDAAVSRESRRRNATALVGKRAAFACCREMEIVPRSNPFGAVGSSEASMNIKSRGMTVVRVMNVPYQALPDREFRRVWSYPDNRSIFPLSVFQGGLHGLKLEEINYRYNNSRYQSGYGNWRLWLFPHSFAFRLFWLFWDALWLLGNLFLNWFRYGGRWWIGFC